MDDPVSNLRTEMVRLIIHQETIYQNWAKFVIAIQGGLGAGFGFVLSELNNYRPLGYVIVVLGGVTAIVLDQILRRHAQWSVWYLERCNALSASSKLFPDRATEPHVIADQRLGHVARNVRWLLWLLALIWAVLLIILPFLG